jgi:hypothetical protein
MSTLVKEQAEFLLDAAKLIEFATEQGWVVTGGELWRTKEQQDIYLKSGKSKTKDSQHLKRLAIDLNFFLDGKLIMDKLSLTPIGSHWESLDSKNRWGGNFKSFTDVPHFERMSN